jgi:membrane fusion protein, multidrug efflux system
MRPQGRFLVAATLVWTLQPEARAQENATTVTTELTQVESGQLEQTTILPGELLPFQEVDLRAKVAGFVERIPVDRGSRVRKGDLIAELSAPELDSRTTQAQADLAAAEASLAEAEARLAAAVSTYQRLSKAAETPGAVADNDLVGAEKMAEAGRAQVASITESVDASRAALAAVEQMTAYLRVTAPFDGVVTERRVHVGTLVGPGADASSLVRLEQVSHLRLVTPVPESYAAGVLKGAEVSFSVSAHVGESFPAVVSRPSLSVSPETRTMAVEADVDNRAGRLAPGMYAEVSWTLRRDKPSLFVPRSAVARTTERIFVIRVRDGKAEWVDVHRGVSQGDRVEVFGDLKPADRVVLRATDEIRPGAAVAAR